MQRVAINGAAGRMGHAIVEAARDVSEVQLARLYVHPDSPDAGQDAPHSSGLRYESSAAIAEHARNKDFDVMIDFSPPESVLRTLEACADAGCPLVSGTTGFDDTAPEIIEQAAAKVPLVFSPNMSIGINLCFHLLGQISRAIGNEADIEIVEMHHRYKRDAPSGTALRMGEVIAKELGADLSQKAVYSRHDRDSERCKGEIGFQALRAGDVVGEHTAMFALDGERIELTHRATDRLIFARGAVRAAIWAVGRPPGLYGMRDVLAV